MSRLASARDTFARARAAGCTDVLVGLSGGKDSLTVLDLAVAEFGAERVKAFFMFLVRGLRCVEDHVDAAARRYGVEVFKVPHYALADCYRHAVLMPHRRDANKWRQMKYVDIEQHVRNLSGFEWVVAGHRMVDSLERRGMLHKAQGCSEKFKRIWPLWEWNTKDVVAYLKAKHIRLPDQLGSTTNVSGVDLRPATLKHLRDHYPDDFAKLCEVFPYAPAAIRKGEIAEARRAEEEAAQRLAAPDGGPTAAVEGAGLLDRAGRAP